MNTRSIRAAACGALAAAGLVPVALVSTISGAAADTPLPPDCQEKTYANFADVDAEDLTINGDAAVTGSSDGQVLRLTPASTNRSGSAFTTQKVNLLNDGSFSTSFAFRISSQGGIEGADGLTFVVQNVANNVGGIGGGLGYQGLTRSVALEFDTYRNAEIGDADNNHVGLDVNGSITSVIQRTVNGLSNLDDGARLHRAWVDYDGVTDTLELRLATSDTRPDAAVLTGTVDIPAILGGSGDPVEDAFIGFTSGTGAGFANHDITRWTFRNCYVPIGTDASPVVDAGGPYAGDEDTALALDGSVTDDRTANPTAAWTYSGPGTCTFGDAAAADTTVTCDVPGSYQLTLTGDDGVNDEVSDVAQLTVRNVNAPPTVTGLTTQAASSCVVTASATFTDPDDGDTATSHTASFAWGDGATSPGVVDESAGSATATHEYTDAGTFTITVTVTDQDGASDDATTSYTTANDAGTFLAPINTGAGQRSVFKLGSTIPVKIRITDCDGALVTTLTPVVHLDKVDGSVSDPVNEALVTEVATNGKQMRWDGSQYHYNLSTKNSQFAAGGPLTAGTYRISVTDPSLAAPRSVVVDLR